MHLAWDAGRALAERRRSLLLLLLLLLLELRGYAKQVFPEALRGVHQLLVEGSAVHAHGIPGAPYRLLNGSHSGGRIGCFFSCGCHSTASIMMACRSSVINTQSRLFTQVGALLKYLLAKRCH